MVADMEVEMEADMEVEMEADMEVDKVVDKVADIVADMAADKKVDVCTKMKLVYARKWSILGQSCFNQNDAKLWVKH